MNHFHTWYCKVLITNLPARKSQLYPWENRGSEQARGRCLRSQSLETVEPAPGTEDSVLWPPSHTADLMTDRLREDFTSFRPGERSWQFNIILHFAAGVKTDFLLWQVSVISSRNHPVVPQVASPVPVGSAAIPDLSPNQITMKSRPAGEPASCSHTVWFPDGTPGVLGLSWTHWSQHNSVALWSSEKSRDTSFHLRGLQFCALWNERNTSCPCYWESKCCAHHLVLADTGTHQENPLFSWGSSFECVFIGKSTPMTLGKARSCNK